MKPITNNFFAVIGMIVTLAGSLSPALAQPSVEAESVESLVRRINEDQKRIRDLSDQNRAILAGLAISLFTDEPKTFEIDPQSYEVDLTVPENGKNGRQEGKYVVSDKQNNRVCDVAVKEIRKRGGVYLQSAHFFYECRSMENGNLTESWLRPRAWAGPVAVYYNGDHKIVKFSMTPSENLYFSVVYNETGVVSGLVDVTGR